MGIVADIRNGREAQSELNELKLNLARYDSSFDHFQERIAELELSLEDDGWSRLGAGGERDFSSSGRAKIASMSRVMYLKNPLIRRGVSVRTYYTFGQGVSVSAPYAPVNDVVQLFQDDPANRQSLTSHVAMLEQDTNLQVEGELFFVFFTNPSTGAVKTRTIRPDEIVDIITNPEDDMDPWFYRRRWDSSKIDMTTGQATTTAEDEAYYPALWFRPEAMPAKINGVRVMAEPIYHMTATTVAGMKRGVPDTYAALDWARSYKDFLSDWASLVRSLNRWAWKYKVGKNQSVSDVKTRLATTVSSSQGETNPAPTTGSVMVTPSDGELTPIPKTGASISADDARALRNMVASAFDLPDTILSGDADVGNYATAKSLDRPTELAMANRQLKWASVYGDILDFVVEQSIIAPSGPLQGTVSYPVGRPVFELATDPMTGEPGDATVNIDFPPILEQDVDRQISAIVSAATLDGKTPAGTIPKEDVSRMLLSALGQSDIDATLATLYPSTEAQDIIASVSADLKEVLKAAKGEA